MCFCIRPCIICMYVSLYFCMCDCTCYTCVYTCICMCELSIHHKPSQSISSTLFHWSYLGPEGPQRFVYINCQCVKGEQFQIKTPNLLMLVALCSSVCTVACSHATVCINCSMFLGSYQGDIKVTAEPCVRVCTCNCNATHFFQDLWNLVTNTEIKNLKAL